MLSNYYVPEKFKNKYGDLNPNSYDGSSENPTTFNVMFYFLLEEARGFGEEDKPVLQERLCEKWRTNNGKLKTNNYDNDDSFSLDESLAYAAACYRYKFLDDMEKLKIVTKQTWYRFYDVIPYLVACKYPLLRYMLLPWISFITLLAIAIVSEGDTSGKQLALIKIIGQKMLATYILAEIILELKGTSFKEALSIYYPEEEHPINVLAREIWSE